MSVTETRVVTLDQDDLSYLADLVNEQERIVKGKRSWLQPSKIEHYKKIDALRRKLGFATPLRLP